MIHRKKLGMLLILSMAGPATLFAEGIDYARDIKPILKARCYACHGGLKQEAAFRLDTGRLIRKGGESGPAVTPEAPDASLLLERVSAKDASERMPPEEEPLTAAQIETLRIWISHGARSPDDEQPEPDPHRHWAFQAPQLRELPRTNIPDRVSNPIDAFVARDHLRHGLTPQPRAPKHVLLRRVYLNLIGLPPSRHELLAFLSDDSPDSYTKVVDRLLTAPQYGERWGRNWMDVWRYSDWYGRRHVPDVWNSAPQIWRWRDWIVRSLNEDKGYDQMIREMLAADEICPEDPELAVATGYLIRNWYALNPNDWMRNTVEHTGKAFLGLTFNCAHCHDHKYDPITQEDYFRLRAFFEPIYVRQDRVAGEPDPGPFQDYNYSTLRKIQRLGAVRIFDKNPDAPTWFYTGGDERNRVQHRGSMAPGVPAFLTTSLPKIEPINLPPRAWYPGLAPEIQETILADARLEVAQAEERISQPDKEKASAPRSVVEARAAAARAELASVAARIAADRAKYETSAVESVLELARQASRLERESAVRQLEAKVISEEHTLAVANAKPADDANRAKEIEAASKQLATSRAALDKAQAAAADSTSENYSPLSTLYPQTSTGRRRAVAKWITSRNNPLTARVAVNHIWMRHFHAPLVSSVHDFGRNGALPTHPELLDWLAIEFMESGWSMKHLHRLIVTSEAYCRLSNAVMRDNHEDGQRNDLQESQGEKEMAKQQANERLWRMNTGRMESEVLRDSLLCVADRLDLKIGGQELENSEALTTFRRTVYYSVYPEQGGKSDLGELFDAPDPLDCYRRTRSIVPQQALALTNSDLIHHLSGLIVSQWVGASKIGTGKDAERRKQTAGQSVHGGDDEPFVVEMFERILSRTPTDAERQICLEALARHRELQSVNPEQATMAARASLVRALLNHNDFVTIR